jgi:hypothetical protein
MRIWHLVAIVIVVAVVFSLLREPEGRVGVVVFCTGIGEVVFGIIGIMSLFHTLGSLGHSRNLGEAALCLTATLVVTTVVAIAMATMFVIGAVLVLNVV